MNNGPVAEQNSAGYKKELIDTLYIYTIYLSLNGYLSSAFNLSNADLEKLIKEFLEKYY